MDQEFWDKLDQWYEEDEHQKIVDAILALPQEEMTYEVLGQLAVAYNNLNQYDDAILQLEKTREEGKTDYKWFYRMGYAYFYQNKEEEAIHYFLRSVQIIDSQPELETDLREDLDEYIQDCQKVVFAKETDLSGFFSEDEIRTLQKLINEHYQSVVENFQKLPEEEQTHEAKIRLATAYNNLTRYDEAIRLLEELKEESENDYEWFYQMGNALFFLDKEGEALPYFVKGLKCAEKSGADQEVTDGLMEMIEECQRCFTKKNHMAPPELYSEEEMKAVEEHIEKYYGEIDGVMHELVSPDIHVDLLSIPPSEERNYYQVFTMGMGAHRMNIPKELEDRGYDRAELMITLPPDWNMDSNEEKDYWPLRWLKILARLPIEQDTWLGVGHSVPNEGPFAENTQLSGVLLILPCGVEEGAEECLLPNGKCINFYQVIPIYEEEMEFKLKNGSKALLEKFSDAEISYVVDLRRINTCRGTGNMEKKEKKYLLSAEEIRELLSGWQGPDGCIATDRIVVDGCKVGYMYREKPADQFPDSGWRFMAGDEPDSYMDNADNSGIYKLNTIVNYDEEILPLLNKPYGTAYYRDENGKLIEEEFLPPEEEE